MSSKEALCLSEMAQSKLQSPAISTNITPSDSLTQVSTLEVLSNFIQVNKLFQRVPLEVMMLADIYSCRNDWNQFVQKVTEIKAKEDLAENLAPIGMPQVESCK